MTPRPEFNDYDFVGSESPELIDLTSLQHDSLTTELRESDRVIRFTKKSDDKSGE